MTFQVKDVLVFIPAKIGGSGQKLIAYCIEEVPLLGVDKGVTEQRHEVIGHNEEIATRHKKGSHHR